MSVCQLNVLSCISVDEVVIGAPYKVTADLLTSLNIHVVCGTATKEVKDSPPCLVPMQQGIWKTLENPSSDGRFLTTDDLVHLSTKIVC